MIPNAVKRMALFVPILALCAFGFQQYNQAARDYERIRRFDMECLGVGKDYISSVTDYRMFVESVLADSERKANLKALLSKTGVPLNVLKARYDLFVAVRDTMVNMHADFIDSLRTIQPPE